MNPNPAFLMIGLPDSGKSTYVGALFHGLRKSSVAGLQLARDPDERDYLLELERQWLSLKPLDRSRHHGAKRIEIPIVDTRTGGEFVLAIPDIVGEEYEDAWQHGGWGETVADWILKSDGILLFVRADMVREASLISVEPVREPGGGTSERWDPSTSPTQAKLCDLLEQVIETREGTLSALAVIVSAWDSAADLNLDPRSWLEWQTPLLSQWLLSNESELCYEVFGISAQGGDVRDPEVRHRLASDVETRPVPNHAVTLNAPLEWLLRQDPT